MYAAITLENTSNTCLAVVLNDEIATVASGAGGGG
jgi:hypothetical protein